MVNYCIARGSCLLFCQYSIFHIYGPMLVCFKWLQIPLTFLGFFKEGQGYLQPFETNKHLSIDMRDTVLTKQQSTSSCHIIIPNLPQKIYIRILVCAYSQILVMIIKHSLVCLMPVI